MIPPNGFAQHFHHGLLCRLAAGIVLVCSLAACGDSDNDSQDLVAADTGQDVATSDITPTQDTTGDGDTTPPDDLATPDTAPDSITTTDTVATDTVSDSVSDTAPNPDLGSGDTGNTDVTTTPDTDQELLNVPDVVGCEVELRIRVAGTVFLATQAGNPVPLTARLRNLTETVQTVTVSDPCPNGTALFSGLPEGYDYYQSCTAGACQGNLPPVVYTLQPKQELVIATATINAAEDPCNQPLPKQTYDLLFGLPLTDDPQPNLCGPAIAAELTIE